MPAVTFRRATEEVAPIAAPLIEEHFPHLLTHNVRIEYIFRSKTTQKNGMAVWGTCRKIGSLSAFLAAREETPAEKKQEPFFVIDLSEPVWRILKAEHREALLHHELSHAGAEYDDKSNTRLFIIPHDLEEFAATYAKYGPWSQAIRNFLAAGEPELDFDAPQTGDSDTAPEQKVGRHIALPGVDNPALIDGFYIPPQLQGKETASLPGSSHLQIEGTAPTDSDVLDAEYTELPPDTIPAASLLGVERKELRTSKRRIGELAQGGLPGVPGGEGAQVIRLEGARYVIVSINPDSGGLESRRVVHSSEWDHERLPYADLSKPGAPCCIGMQVTDPDGVRWIIDSDVAFQVLALERRIK